ISGKITNLIGIGESGIGVSLVNDLTGDEYTATTGLDGSYSFPGLESGSFTVIPEQTEFNTVSPASKNVIVTTDSVRKVNFKVYSLCTKTLITIPFWGTTDSTVNIIGSFFGTTPAPDDTSTVAVTLYDGTTTSVAPGVYFGTNDPSSWVKATVDYWSPVYITAKVPVLALRVVRVWVVRPGLSACITNSPLNFFINTNQ
ncbi:MAG: carboxypeptidase regulatory-like domain-containing protein, partial [Deltaproteobacteria bacterium]|nr:carboxypeptidase regulatory-like domain-containing protein [Deltaproteobacteria bacterium]